MYLSNQITLHVLCEAKLKKLSMVEYNIESPSNLMSVESICNVIKLNNSMSVSSIEGKPLQNLTFLLLKC